MHNSNNGMTTQRIVLILGAFVIVAAAAVGLIMFLNRADETVIPAVAPAEAEVITAENVTSITQEAQASVERGMFMTHMNMIWNFADGESASYNAVMGNSSSNTYPLWFTLTLDSTNEEIFRSGLIPVGTTIAEIKLSKDLEPGNYPATVMINLVEDDGSTPIETNMGFSVTLIIES